MLSVLRLVARISKLDVAHMIHTMRDYVTVYIQTRVPSIRPQMPIHPCNKRPCEHNDSEAHLNAEPYLVPLRLHSCRCTRWNRYLIEYSHGLRLREKVRIRQCIKRNDTLATRVRSRSIKRGLRASMSVLHSSIETPLTSCSHYTSHTATLKHT